MWHEYLYRVLSIINYIVLIIIAIPLLIQILNVALCWVKKKKFKKSNKYSRVAYIIAARNEDDVIFDTVKNIFDKQIYPKDKLDVYVIAHNCTDNTASLAKKAGAIVLEVNDNDPSHRKVAYPLKIGVDRILSENKYDLVIRLDADNHINDEFTTLMNDAYQEGNDFLRPYEGCLNGSQNFYTKACAMFYSFDSRYGSRVREFFNLSAHVNGSGSVMSTRMLNKIGGYDTTTISEDAEFCFNRLLEGQKAHFVEDAVIYEDMPSTLEDTVSRNKRIASGGTQHLKGKMGQMFMKFFKTGDFSYIETFLTYIFLFLTPLLVIWMPLFYIYNFTYLGLIEAGKIVLPINSLFSYSYYHCVLWNTIWSIVGIVGGLFILFGFVQAIILVLTEYKKFGCKSRKEMIDAGFLFPAYLMVYAVTMCIGVFSKPEWKKVKRNSKKG